MKNIIVTIIVTGSFFVAGSSYGALTSSALGQLPSLPVNNQTLSKVKTKEVKCEVTDIEKELKEIDKRLKRIEKKLK